MKPRSAVTYRNREKAEAYAEALRLVGIEPVLISPDAARSLEGLKGLLLSGGTDVDPSLYGSEPRFGQDEPDRPRDALEQRLLTEALAQHLPVLAICRGMQLFNVAHGGTLIQHLDGHVFRTDDPRLPAHSILVEPGTRLGAILGPGTHAVNSRHHQAVEKIGLGLRVSARAAGDGVVEALEREDRPFAIAVQWHPEDQVSSDDSQKQLFQGFAEQLEERARSY